jgi:hypothetical protein
MNRSLSTVDIFALLGRLFTRIARHAWPYMTTMNANGLALVPRLAEKGYDAHFTGGEIRNLAEQQ